MSNIPCKTVEMNALPIQFPTGWMSTKSLLVFYEWPLWKWKVGVTSIIFHRVVSIICQSKDTLLLRAHKCAPFFSIHSGIMWYIRGAKSECPCRWASLIVSKRSAKAWTASCLGHRNFTRLNQRFFSCQVKVPVPSKRSQVFDLARLWRTDYWGLEMFDPNTWTHKSFRPLTVSGWQCC